MADIWVTSRCHMCAEKRYLKYNFWNYILLNYYSVLLIVVSLIFNNEKYAEYDFSKINIAISVVLLSISLLTYGFRFGETAAKHKECYIKLQNLESKKISEEERLKQYFDILEIYPNHETKDYYALQFERYWAGDAEFKNKISLTNGFLYLVRFIGFYMFVLICLLSLPVFFYCIH